MDFFIFIQLKKKKLKVFWKLFLCESKIWKLSSRKVYSNKELPVHSVSEMKS